jgi:sugar lactone lactonase YvrE
MRWTGLLAALAVLLIAGSVEAKKTVRLRPMPPIGADANGGPIEQPEGVGCRDRTVLISDTGNGRLLSFEVEEDVMTPSAPIELPELPRPTRVALNSKGEIFAVDSRLRRVAKISAAGEFVEYVSLGPSGSGFQSAPRSVAIDGDDNLYVLDTYAATIVVLTAEGEPLRRIAFPDGYSFIADIAVDSFGILYAVDAVRKTVYSAKKDELQLTPLADGLPEDLESPAGLAVGAGGHIFVTDQGGGSIVILSRDGEFVARQSGMGWKSGRLRYPTAICVDDQGDLFVADRENNRIQVFFVLH